MHYYPSLWAQICYWIMKEIAEVKKVAVDIFSFSMHSLLL